MRSPGTTASGVGIEEKVAFLLRPGSYASAEGPIPAAVHAVETHMAWVFLTGRHAWKLKKPVRYDFLDFSTVEARHRDGLEELALNARLAPGVYEEVVALTLESGGRLAIGGAGVAVDWLVRMRQLPGGKFLDQRIRAGGVVTGEIAALASALATFYGAAPRVGLSGDAYRARLASTILDDVETLLLHDHDANGAERLGAALVAFIDAEAGLFESRAGWIVEGHGDLRPEHVCLTHPPVVIDCLEFNHDFRMIDPVDELAFLAMECELIGGAEVGRQIAGAVCRALGDDPPEDLFDFYAAARALLRAKLALSHVWDVGPDRHDQWRAKGRAYLGLACLRTSRLGR